MPRSTSTAAVARHAVARESGPGLACPNCGSRLAQYMAHGRIAHACPKGHGKLYNASCLRAWVVDDYQLDFGTALSRGRQGERNCPRCNKQFQLTMFYRLPVEHCRSCAVAWLSDALFSRLPLRPEKEREHATNIGRLPVGVHVATGFNDAEALYSPFAGLHYGKHTPWATLGLLVACALVTHLFWQSGYPEYFVSLPRQPGRFFGVPMVLSLFTHGTWGHLLGNGYFLLVAGAALESTLGWKKFLGLFFACGFGADIAHALVTPAGGIGASGAISGVILALVASQPKAFYLFRPLGPLFGVPIIGNLFNFSIKIPLWLWAFLWFGMDLYLMGQQMQGNASDHIGHAAHIGGAVLGALLASLPVFQENEPAKANKPIAKPIAVP